MRADQVTVGMQLNVRGFRATVTKVWTTKAGATKSFFEPFGIEFTWTDEYGKTQFTRMVWPWMSHDDRWMVKSGFRLVSGSWVTGNQQQIDNFVANLASTDLTNIQVTQWV